MKKTITIPPSTTPVTVTAEAILTANGDTATMSLDVSATASEQPTTPTPPPEIGKLILATDFSKGTGTADRGQMGKGGVVDYKGEAVFRCYVPRWSASISGGYRSELRFANIIDKGHMKYMGEVTIEKIPPSGETQIWQWHPNSSTGSSTLRLNITDGWFTIVRNLGKNEYANWSKKIELGRKYLIEWDIIWSEGKDGLIRLYIDGFKQFEYTGPTMKGGVYAKYGINTWDSRGGSPDGDAIAYIHYLQIFEV